MRFSILSFFSLLASLLLSTGAVAEHAGEQKKQNNAAVGVAGDLSLEEAAKIYFATMLISVEHPEVNKKLAAELSKKLADSDSKIVGSIDPNAIKSSSVPTAILSSIFFSAVMDPGQTGKHLPAASGLSLLSSGSSVCTSSFLPHKLADYKNGLLKKNGKDFDKTIDRESLTKAVQDEVTVRSGLLGKMLQWSPEQEQKFASAYRNAIYVSFETHSGQLYEEYDPKQPPGTESWELSPGKVNSRSELPNVIDVIEKNKLASKTEIAALKQMKIAEDEMSSLCKVSKSVADRFEGARPNTTTHDERAHLSNKNSYLQGRVSFINTVLDAFKEVRKDPELGNQKDVLLKMAEIEENGQNALYKIERIRKLSEYLVPHQQR